MATFHSSQQKKNSPLPQFWDWNDYGGPTLRPNEIPPPVTLDPQESPGTTTTTKATVTTTTIGKETSKEKSLAKSLTIFVADPKKASSHYEKHKHYEDIMSDYR